MTQTANAHETSLAAREPQDTPPVGGKAAKDLGLTSVDSGQFANLLDRSRFEQIYSVANLFASSKMVPTHYQGSPADCFIGVQMAIRLGVDPFMFLQNTYIVHGRPGMEAKLAIALINSSGLFSESLDYEIDGGDDPFSDTYRVRAFAPRKSTGKLVHGPWIDWKLVKAEGWDRTNGSKWKTMPGLMFQYRAGTFFGRLHCPERLMGMQTVDEVEDVGRVRQVDNTAPARGAQGLAQRLAAKPAADATPIDDPRPTQEEASQVVEQDSEPATEPADEPADADEPSPHVDDALVKQLANKAGCTLEEALERIEQHCVKVKKKSLPDLTKAQREDVGNLIEAGTITV